MNYHVTFGGISFRQARHWCLDNLDRHHFIIGASEDTITVRAKTKADMAMLTMQFGDADGFSAKKAPTTFK